MRALLDVILLALELYTWAIVIMAVMSWLISFGVINIHNQLVRQIWDGLGAVTEPLLRPIRRFLPGMGGLDISPVILLLVIYFVRQLIAYNFYPMAIGF